jgi:hypothetical protein
VGWPGKSEGGPMRDFGPGWADFPFSFLLYFPFFYSFSIIFSHL